MKNKDIWDEIYQTDYLNLPWYGIPFSNTANKFIRSNNKKDLIVIPGCGAGDVAKKIYDIGFHNIFANDISSEAIKQASKRFPYINFKNIKTQDIDKNKINDSITFDWMNLHDIPPKDLSEYLNKLKDISKKILITYLYESGKDSRHSYVHKELTVHSHNPKIIENFLKPMKLKHQEIFSIETNPNLKERHQHKSVLQIYEK